MYFVTSHRGSVLEKKERKKRTVEREEMRSKQKTKRRRKKNQFSRENQRLLSVDVAIQLEFKILTIKALSLLQIRLRKL